MTLKLPRWLRRDFGMKLLAVFFAVLIWSTVYFRLLDTRRVPDVPVHVEAEFPVKVLSVEPSHVSVVVAGAKHRIDPLRPRDISIVLHIGTVPDEMYVWRARITPHDVRTPFGVRVKEIVPAVVTVNFGHIVRKENVPVRVRFQGRPREGYEMTRSTAVPSAVRIIGLRRVVAAIDEVVTEFVPLDDAVQSFQKDGVRLVTEEGVRAEPPTVTVKVTVRKAGAENTFTKLPLYVMRAPVWPFRAVCHVKTADVTVRGPQDVLRDLTAKQMHPFVDVGDLANPGRYRVPVQVWLSVQRVTVLDVRPQEVEVEVLPASPAASPKGTPPKTAPPK